MRKAAPDKARTQLIQTLGKMHGLRIDAYDESFLQKSIDKRMAETGIKNVAAYEEYLAGNQVEAERFCQSLRINYSEFFRNSLTFALLEQQVLPALIAAKKQSGQKEIRIWSAGCAAGQEIWSVAILLDELLTAKESPVSYRIFATDLSESDLAKARAGIYSAEAVGNICLKHLNSCFSRQGDAYVVVPWLRKQVDFSVYDLLDEHSSCPADSLYGDFDLILCCNLLFYYKLEIRQRVISKVCRALANGGFFVTGEAERDMVTKQEGFCPVAPASAIFQKRGEK
jgi:chemotaxis methyl-accepting protein methylase